MTRRWLVRAPASGSPDQTLSSPSPGGAPAPLLERILAARGLTGDAALAFLDASLKDLHVPSLIPDLDKAAARILAALSSSEPLVIYGDYDVDGITASAILFHVCRALRPGAPVRTYVPHRVDEGYGLNTAAIEQLAAGSPGIPGAKVIVSVDCGVTALEPARTAQRLGVDLIITDHHNPPASLAELPEAFAVVHPRRPDSAYPFGELSGAGVAYKLAWRLATLDAGSERAAPALRTLLIDLLAFAALGTIADIVPLVGENRVIARFGLTRIKESPLTGLRALVEAAGLAGASVDAWDVGFRLGPRLNAIGRMAHAADAVELFTTADAPRAAAIATALEARNQERRAVEKAIFEQAAQLAAAAGMTGPERRAIVLAHPDWHPGVVGIVCSRLVEKFARPVILLATREGAHHGSARSIPGFNLHAAIAACSQHLDRFGGHDMAAGLHMPEANLAAFTDAFIARANALITPEQLTPTLTIDARAHPAELSAANVRSLERLGPFGSHNPAVHLLLEDLVIESAMPLGREGAHLALAVRHGQRHFRLVAWGWGERRASLPAGLRIDAVIHPKISLYRGEANVEPELLDLRPISQRP